MAVIMGVIAGFVVTSIGEMISHAVYPSPEGFDYNDKQAIAAYIETLPVGAFIILMLGWALASFAGGAVASKLSKSKWYVWSLLTGTILMAGAIMNFINIPHPIWMSVVAVVLYLPMAFLGGKLMRKGGD